MGAKRRALGWLAALALGAGCIPPGEANDERAPAPPVERAPAHAERELPPPDPDSAVVLVVLDGARWQDVFTGADAQLAASAGVTAPSAEALMPHLHALLGDRGVALGAPGQGAPIAASGPSFVSLPGYTEIFTGRRSHACADNDCAPAHAPTLMDEARTERTGDVAVFASWERIQQAVSIDPARLVLSTGRSATSHDELLRDDGVTAGLLDRGARASPFPGYADFRPDGLTAALALRYLEIKRPRLMFLGVGEPDEYAHRGDYAGYLASLRDADATLGDLFAALDRMGSRGRDTTVFVTADHGRARDYRFHGRQFPESARVWLVAAGGGIEARGLARSTRPHRLADVAPTIRALLDLPADVAPSSGTPIEEIFASPPERSAMRP